jgi:hypothetical protein
MSIILVRGLLCATFALGAGTLVVAQRQASVSPVSASQAPSPALHAPIPADGTHVFRRSAAISTPEGYARVMDEMSSDADAEDSLSAAVVSSIQQENFADLDALADRLRNNKARLPGGTFKLYFFYDRIGKSMEGADEAAWRELFKHLNAWNAQRPDSVTAQLALANAYMTYAWQARGHGYGHSVSDDGWQLFRERVAESRKTIESSHALGRDPYAYSLMIEIALQQDWDRQKRRALFQQAVAQQPDFYHYYREYANGLQTKWGGAEGEVQTFATESANAVGGKQGDFLYFELASLVNCSCNDTLTLSGMSWPRIQRGFAAMQELYGVSDLKLNRYAMLALKAHDFEQAVTLFDRIGNHWDPSVWNEQARFERAKAAAKDFSSRQQVRANVSDD